MLSVNSSASRIALSSLNVLAARYRCGCEIFPGVILARLISLESTFAPDWDGKVCGIRAVFRGFGRR
jgi:hypothetical protein